MPHTRYSSCSTSQYTQPPRSQVQATSTTPLRDTHTMSPVSKAGRWGGEAASPHMHSALWHMRTTQCTMSPVQRAGCGEAVLPARPACTLLARAVAARGGGSLTDGAPRRAECRAMDPTARQRTWGAARPRLEGDASTPIEYPGP